MNAGEGESYLKLAADSRSWLVPGAARFASSVDFARRAAQACKNEQWPSISPDVTLRHAVNRGACSTGRSHDPVESGKTRSCSFIDFMVSEV